MLSKINSLSIEKDQDGNIESAEISFGPHFAVRVDHEGRDESLRFVLVATHHGFMADASEVGGELEEIIYKIRNLYPQNTVD